MTRPARALAAVALLFASASPSQTRKVAVDDAVDFRVAGIPLAAPAPNAEIAAALQRVSPEAIRSNINHLMTTIT